MAGDETQPDWPPLTGAELRVLLRGYPSLGRVFEIVWHSPRPLSAACLVETSVGTIFIKRHHRRVRPPAVLEEEHRFMAHLWRGGIPVPIVMPGADGRTAAVIGNWVYEVHRQADGIDLYRESVSWSPLRNRHHAQQAGTVLATLHDAAEDYAAAQRQTHLLVARSEVLCADDPVQALRAQLPRRPALKAWLAGRDWSAELRDLMARSPPGVSARLRQQPRLWTHGDWHASNLCWNGEGDSARVTAVLDFGLAASNFALFDLATAIERNAIAWLALETGQAAAHTDIARGLIDGYRARRPLNGADINLLADLLPRVHIDFALSEVEYFSGVLDSGENAGIAWNVFLLGHAAWFETAPGRAMLQAIRDCA